MSLLNDASLILVPSAIKTGEVLVQKPLPNKFADETGNYDGNDPQTSANLTFTRASSATRVASNGLIERVRTNLLTYSSDFSNAAWIKSVASGSVTAEPSELDPNGNTGTVYRFDATSGNVYQNTQATGVQYTISFYVKSGGGGNDTFRLRIGGFESSVLTATASWVRYTFTQVPAAAVYAIRTDGAGSTNVLISLAQLETGDIATPYIATTTAAVSVGPVSGLPRLDYLGSSCPRLLLEPQRTNSVLWSEQIDNAGWAKVNLPTITTNIATAPDGYGGADGIQDTTGGTYKRVRQSFSVAANGTHTASVFVKKETSETNYGGLALVFTNRFVYGIIDAVNGTLTVSSDSYIASSSTKVEDYGTYWRFSLTATDDQSNTSLDITYYATLSTNGTSTGVGAGSVRTIWGFQLEIGASYATSYIPTLGAAVTRGAESASKTGIASLIGQTEGTLFIDMEFEGYDNNNKWLAFLGSGSSYIALYTTNSSRFTAEVANPTAQFNSSSFVFAVGQRYKLALAYKANDFAFYVNGTQVATDNSGTVPATSEFNFQYDTATNNLTARTYNQALLFPTRLSNSSLAELTA
jgi:hypothetical protein